MADPFDTLFDPANDNLGADFEAYCGGLKPVTVRKINAQTGATITTVSNVSALKRVRRVAVAGQVGYESARFLMRLATVGFTPTAADEVEGTDSVIWQINDGPNDVEVIGFAQLVAVNCSKKRTDASQ